jgi:opacity protein-like surface antigen
MRIAKESLKNFAIAMLLLLTTSMTHADELSGHISGYIGLKTMDSSDWPDLDTHFSMGVVFDIKKDSWPISIVLDLVDTGDKHNHDGMEDLGHTTEYQLGIRKIFMNQHSKIQPYIGGGISFMYAELEFEENNITTTQDDRDAGGWFGAGMYYEINPKFVLGLDVRYSHGEVILFDKERDAGGIHTGVTGGFQF